VLLQYSKQGLKPTLIFLNDSCQNHGFTHPNWQFQDASLCLRQDKSDNQTHVIILHQSSNCAIKLSIIMHSHSTCSWIVEIVSHICGQPLN